MKIKCWECGKITEDIRYSLVPLDIVIPEEIEIPISDEPNQLCRCYFPECAKKVYEEEKADIEAYIRLKKKAMFRNGLRLLEKQGVDMYDYREAIDVVEEHIKEYPDKYDSSYEVVAAIVLVKNRIRAKMQFKIGKYQVDFLLPELYVVLEIDGAWHKQHKRHDRNRDAYIREQLGQAWEIIRIKTKYLDMNAKHLPDAIYDVLQYREEGKVDWKRLYSGINEN